MNTPNPRSILCGTDFSRNAAEAMAAAAALARRGERSLILLHVADEFNSHARTPEALAQYLEPTKARLAAEAQRLATDGAEVTSEVIHGRVAEQAILGYAREHGVELVVVSAVSKTAFDRWTLGSVSERVAEAAPTPTLVVRSAAPFVAWARGERPLKVFVAADFSASAEAALHWARDLRQHGPCEIIAAHVDWPPEENARLGSSGPMDITRNQPAVQRVLERDLREKITAILGTAAVELWVRAGWGRVDAHLVELASKAQADILVVGTHQRRGLERWTQGSVSRGILRHAPMSVACVPLVAGAPATPGVRPCRRVLAAVDLEAEGNLALPYAYSVVNEGGMVRLLHVRKSRQAPASRASKSAVSERVADDSGRLRALVPAAADQRRVRTEIEICHDDEVARAIGQAAESWNADLVCIGAHARPGPAARVMGSVALSVLQHSRRPVLIVWPPE